MPQTTTGEFELLDEEAEAFGIQTNRQKLRRTSLHTSTGAALSTIVWGGRKPDLVLLHGGGLNAHTWDATVMAMNHPALAVDLPGHGDSDWRADADYRAEQNAAPVIEALQQLAAPGATVVGQSLGGLTALAVAAADPSLIGALVIVDISPGLIVQAGHQVGGFLDGPTDFATRDEIVQRALDFGFGPDRAAVARGVFHNTRTRPDGRVVFKHHLANLGDTSPVFSADFTTLWPAAENLAVPVLLVRGARGFLSDAVVAEFLDRVPDSTSVSIDSGHNVQEEAPVELAGVITDFISSRSTT